MTDQRKIRLLKAALRRAVLFVPSPLAITIWRILDIVT